MRLDPLTREEADRLCNSPAEAAFLTAFSAICTREAKRRNGNAAEITIKPHCWVEGLNDFRVDFLIRQGPAGLVVECDDLSLEPLLDGDRDRLFLDSHYGVYRFTTDEIAADAERCAQAAFDYFDARALVNRPRKNKTNGGG